MTKRTFSSDAISVHWESERCIHTAICLNALPQVFDLQRRPWIKAGAEDAATVAAAVERCPTGALTYERHDGAIGEQPREPVSVVPWPNGPLMVRGAVEVIDAKGELFATGNRMTLCRCGHSQNQPFCDLSHRAARFRNNPRVIRPDRDTAESPTDISRDPAA